MQIRKGPVVVVLGRGREATGHGVGSWSYFGFGEYERKPVTAFGEPHPAWDMCVVVLAEISSLPFRNRTEWVMAPAAMMTVE